MWFPGLEYPRGQTFAIPYITTGFYTGSLVIVALLGTLNTALVGNDVVTVLKKDPNNVDAKWWAPDWLPEGWKIPSIPGPCQPVSIPLNIPSIRTNSPSPIFNYAILNFQSQGTDALVDKLEGVDGSLGRQALALPYQSESLKNCSVQNMTAVLVFQDGGFYTTSQIMCDLQKNKAESTQRLKLSTTFSRVANIELGADDVRAYISPYAVSWAPYSDATQLLASARANRPDLTVIGVMDAIGNDLMKSIWAHKWFWKARNPDYRWPDQVVFKWAAQVNCTNPIYCRIRGETVEGIDSWYSFTRGMQRFAPEELQSMNTTIMNYFMALRDALHLDLGKIDREQNMFLSSSAFQAKVLSDNFLEDLNKTLQTGYYNSASIRRRQAPVVPPPPIQYPDAGDFTSEEFWKTCAWGWGCLNGTWTKALLGNDPAVHSITSNLPLSAFDNVSSTIIDVDYVCPVFKTKPIGELLVSVFVGTFTMYTALYGIFIFLAPIFDQKYRKKHGLPQFSVDEGAFTTRRNKSPRTSILTQRLSSTSYTTIPTAPELHHQYNQGGSHTQHDSVSGCVFTRAPKPGDELPPGAYSPGIPGFYTPRYSNPVTLLPPISQISKITLTRPASRVSEFSNQTSLHDDPIDSEPTLGGHGEANPPQNSSPHQSVQLSPPIEGEQSALLGSFRN
ncbi:unnamed protein product [Rhizoctonia solani]|uniref:Uncharacterized protein n=1 Tax=Rhizoctonia solani TaxID=456999 RepID=A0A8H3GPG4_9AGAM|nr:unnamed protein product [Rhizoctonia solani]